MCALQLPEDAGITSYAVDQRWGIDNCTMSSDDWPFSWVPHQLIDKCVVGGLVPEDAGVSISVNLVGLKIGALDLSTNSGAVEARNVTAYSSLRVRAARGFKGFGLQSRRFTFDTLGGDIEIDQVVFRQNESYDSIASDSTPRARFSRGAGWVNTREDFETRVSVCTT